MKALSIRQPWAWLIVNGHKDVENRTWPTRYRGPVLIHASKGMTTDEYCDALWSCLSPVILVPQFEKLERGGIVGVATLVDSVTHSDSRWYTGAHGFVLRDARPLPFTPFKGALGFFETGLDIESLQS
jgi:hypothetical protein